MQQLCLYLWYFKINIQNNSLMVTIIPSTVRIGIIKDDHLSLLRPVMHLVCKRKE